MQTQTITGIPVIGKFKWEFEISGSGTQASVHEFFPGHIHYCMTGPAHTTAYTQNLVAFDPAEQRCITKKQGEDTSGTYYLMFFKDMKENEVTIYKRKCASREEAEKFPFPPAGTREDHGWNTYIRI